MHRSYFLSAALLAFAGPALAAPAMGLDASVPVASPSDSVPPIKQHWIPRRGMPPAAGTAQEAFGTATEIPRGRARGFRTPYQASGKAGTIIPGDRQWRTTPPPPPLVADENTGPGGYLADARMALDSHQPVRAQEALERAETAMLDRSVVPSRAGIPNASDGVVQIRNARDALARGDLFGAKMAIAAAMRPG